MAISKVEFEALRDQHIVQLKAERDYLDAKIQELEKTEGPIDDAGAASAILELAIKVPNITQGLAQLVIEKGQKLERDKAVQDFRDKVVKPIDELEAKSQAEASRV